jgi:hypothetical protein
MRADFAKVARLVLWCLCLGAISGCCYSQASSANSKNQAIHLHGRVIDQSAGRAIDGARVRLFPSANDACWRTDSNGKFSFWISKQEIDRVEVGAEGYETLLLPAIPDALREVRLKPGSAAAYIPSNFSASNAVPMPPSPDVAPAIMTADSGPQSSGTGANWSPWYRLKVGKAPAGYTVHRVEFWLSGDGACGRSAECREVAANDQQVLWEFRMQGHDQIGAPSRTVSVAHMRVLYRSR